MKKFLSLILFFILILFVLERNKIFYSPSIENSSYILGVYHVHSKNSDGAGTLEEIADEAKKAGISFVILTDHGKPNKKSSFILKEVDGVKFFGGSEIDTVSGHMTSFGFDFKKNYWFSPFPEQTLEDILSEGGFPIVAYPEDPKYRWSFWEDEFLPSGIEIMNLSTFLRRRFKKPLSFLKIFFFYPLNKYYLLNIFESPEYSLSRWNKLLKKGNVFSFYALDAHGRTPLTKKLVLRYPSYSMYFKLMGIVVPPEEKKNIFKALKNGRFYSVVFGAGIPQRMSFFGKGGSEKIEYSGCIKSEKFDIVFRLNFKKYRVKKVIIFNGKKVKEGFDDTLTYRVNGRGWVRAEAYIYGHPLLSKDVPWILTNPIRNDCEIFNAKNNKEEYKYKILKELPLNEFKVEKDKYSFSKVYLKDGSLIFEFKLKGRTEKLKDLWCALALRKDINIGKYSGIYIETKGSETLRGWLEVRKGDDWYFNSIKFIREKKGYYFPFKEFWYYFKGKRKIPQKIDSIIISFDNSTIFFGKYTVNIDKIAFFE